MINEATQKHLIPQKVKSGASPSGEAARQG
jgi:hypothetical protein